MDSIQEKEFIEGYLLKRAEDANAEIPLCALNRISYFFASPEKIRANEDRALALLTEVKVISEIIGKYKQIVTKPAS